MLSDRQQASPPPMRFPTIIGSSESSVELSVLRRLAAGSIIPLSSVRLILSDLLLISRPLSMSRGSVMSRSSWELALLAVEVSRLTELHEDEGWQ